MNYDWYQYAQQLSVEFGSGDLVADFMGVTLFISFVALMVGLITYRRERGGRDATPSLERLHGMNGRLEKIERTLNEFRSEMMRQNEIGKVFNEFTKQEIIYVREGIDELLARKGGGSPPPTSGGRGGEETSRVTTRELSEADLESLRETEPAHDVTNEAVLEQEVAAAKTVESRSGETRNGLFIRLRRTRDGLVSKVKGFFAGKEVFDASMIEDLEELLITSDIGVKTTMEIIKNLQARLSNGEKLSESGLYQALEQYLSEVLSDARYPSGEVVPVVSSDGPFTVLLVGVNGAGKTTTIAKLAHQWHSKGLKVMVAAADTYRAAAVAQLREWAERIDVPIVSGSEGAKPATVVFDAMVAAKKQGIDVLLIDTAGRLQNKSNLMQELEGIKNAMVKHQANTPHEVLLVVDGASGQNALLQAREFNAAVSLTGVVVTKLDGTPKGGIVVAIKTELGIPVRYIGVGERREDLKSFNAADFAHALVADADLSVEDSTRAELGIQF